MRGRERERERDRKKESRRGHEGKRVMYKSGCQKISSLTGPRGKWERRRQKIKALIAGKTSEEKPEGKKKNDDNKDESEREK